MKAHISYTIFPKAMDQFFQEHYNQNTIGFGNVENNMNAILKKLKIDTVLTCTWDIPDFFFFDKMNLSKENNKLSDFHEIERLKFFFTTKTDTIALKDYENAVKILKHEFIEKYQDPIKIELEKKKKEQIENRKKIDKKIYIATGIFISLLAIFAVIYKTLIE